MHVRITTRFLVVGENDLDAETDRLFEALVKCESMSGQLSEADVSAALADRIVDMTIVVRADSWSEAQREANGVFFHAIEMAGGLPLRDEAGEEQLDDPRAHIVQGTELVPAR